LAKGDLTEARIWRVVRKDGQVFTFASIDIDLKVDGLTYSAATGFSASAVSNTGSLAVDNLEVAGFMHSASITDADIVAGRWDAATVYVADVNYRNVTQGRTVVATGFVGNVNSGLIGFSVECRGLSQLLSQNIGRTVTASCDANVFDARCGLDPAPYLVTGIVTASADHKHFADTSITHASGWFDFGLVTWTSGANVGLSQEIKRQELGNFTLQLRMPYVIAPGDTYSMLPGCNKLLKGGSSGDLGEYNGDCKVKYNNVVNFRGHPEVPRLNRTIGEANAP